MRLRAVAVRRGRGLSTAASWQVVHQRNPSAGGRDAPYPPAAEQTLSMAEHDAARAQLRTWPEYAPTPLVEHRRLAEMCGVSRVLVKDESRRGGVGSFKVLGGALVVEDLALGAAEGPGSVTIATASAGNHGLGVAWGAQRAGTEAVVYLHSGVSEPMAEKMRALGARVRRVEGSYEDSVRQCVEESEANGWHVVQDVSWPGYEAIPRRINAGYSALAAEACEQVGEGMPTHVLVNAGVGGFASAIFAYFWLRAAAAGVPRPRFVTVEPTEADCCLHALQAGELAARPRSAAGTVQTGLDCNEVTPLAWHVLRTGVDDCLAVPDAAVGPTMRFLAESEPPIAAGESAVAGVAALLSAAEDPALSEALQLDGESVVLAVVCEAPPDAESFHAAVGRTPAQVLAARSWLQ